MAKILKLVLFYKIKPTQESFLSHYTSVCYIYLKLNIVLLALYSTIIIYQS